MANEIWHNYESGSTLYACRFQLDGDVFLTDGASDETWGTGGDADNYDVTMAEDGSSGHYTGSFDASGNIAAGSYRVTVFLQAGGSPADSDIAIAEGEIHWDGTAELNVSTLDDDVDSLTIRQLMLAGALLKILNIYRPGE